MPRRSWFIAHLIQRSIAEGEFGPGTILPPEGDLAQRYRATLGEVRLALVRLEADGLIALREDLTAVVRLRRTQTHFMSTTGDLRKATFSPDAKFDEEGRRAGLAPAHRTEVDTCPAPVEVADQLEIDVGQLVVHRRTVRLTTDEPSVLEDSYYPCAVFAEPYGDANPGDVDELLDALGYMPVGWLDTVAARPPSLEESSLLVIAASVPVIDHRRVVYSMLSDRQIRPVFYTRTVFASDRNRLTYQHKQRDVPPLQDPGR